MSFQIWSIFCDYDPEGIDTISILPNPVTPAHENSSSSSTVNGSALVCPAPKAGQGTCAQEPTEKITMSCAETQQLFLCFSTAVKTQSYE